MSGYEAGDDVRDAVITIQGGGVYGLTLLGQLQEIIDGLKFTPMALAGTSAGAIIATLVWARLSPTQIREKLVSYAKAKDQALVHLLGPFESDGNDFRFGDLAALKNDLRQVIDQARAPKLKPFGNLFQPQKWGICTLSRLFAIKRKLAVHLGHRGFFCGDNLENFIEECLTEAPDVKAFKGRIGGEKLKFKHFRELVKTNGSPSFRVPLFITVTNLTTRRLELINSVDDEYLNVPIAKAVRASAGFPVFFRPAEMPGATEHDCYVDGGVVSNFPAWIFADLFRKKIQQSSYFRWFASKAWVHIGLRVGGGDNPLQNLQDPMEFLAAFVGMLTGHARNVLETYLADMVPRSITIRQPLSETDGPGGVLDVETLNSDKVIAMVTRGRDFAAEKLKDCPRSIVRLSNGKDVEDELKNLVQRCELILGETHDPPSKLRANVFLAIEHKLKLMFRYNMEDEELDKERFVFDFDTGLTGHCYTSRCPMLCNLGRIRELAEKKNLGADRLFGMTSEEHAQVRRDRTWLASVPIFDPYDFSLERNKIEIGAKSEAPHSFRISSPVDGGVLGTLNLDAAFDYAALKIEEDPAKHFSNPRVQAILDTMQGSAVRIGVFLVETFDSVR